MQKGRKEDSLVDCLVCLPCGSPQGLLHGAALALESQGSKEGVLWAHNLLKCKGGANFILQDTTTISDTQLQGRQPMEIPITLALMAA